MTPATPRDTEPDIECATCGGPVTVIEWSDEPTGAGKVISVECVACGDDGRAELWLRKDRPVLSFHGAVRAAD